MKLLFVVNNPAFFLSHRLAIGLAARREGYEVHVATPEMPGFEQVKALGFHFHAVPIDRSKGNPLREAVSVISLVRLYRRLRPDIIHHVTIKPVLYGTLAARIARIPAVVNAISGLGYVFIRRGAVAFLIRTLVMVAYRVSFGHRNMRVIFQNPDDAGLFLRFRLLTSGQSALVRGSGVDIRAFAPRPEPVGTPLIVLASRMLWDKGVAEFVAAAKELKSRGVEARFALVGGTDAGNPACVAEAWLRESVASGAVEWWGHREDMEGVLPGAHIVCLPSYREGLPKVLIEAASCGRPIVATDVPGCREIVRDGVNGLLVKPRDTKSLADSLARLISGPELRRRLGEAGRHMAVSEFSNEIVERDTLNIYREVLHPKAPMDDLKDKPSRDSRNRNAAARRVRESA